MNFKLETSQEIINNLRNDGLSIDEIIEVLESSLKSVYAIKTKTIFKIKNKKAPR